METEARELIQRLSPRMLEVIVLVGRDGLKYQDVADRLDISVATVKQYASMARQRLDSDDSPRHTFVRFYWRVLDGTEVVKDLGLCEEQGADMM